MKWKTVPTTYFVNKTLCENIRVSVYPWMFNSLLCNNIDFLIASAFDYWLDIFNKTSTRVNDVRVADLSFSLEGLQNDTLGQTIRHSQLDQYNKFVHIEIANHSCWVLDNRCCFFTVIDIKTFTVLYLLSDILLTIIFIFFLNKDCISVYLCLTSLVFSFFAFYAIVLPCYDCYNLSITVLHEIGHAFGLDHSNESHIMPQHYNHMTQLCLTPNDIASVKVDVHVAKSHKDDCMQPDLFPCVVHVLSMFVLSLLGGGLATLWMIEKAPKKEESDDDQLRV